MMSLEIHNCKYCVTLPPLGKLLFLKNLHIDGMSLLETIGLEFYGMDEGGSDSSFQPFPSLQNLTFEDMPNWNAWLQFEGNEFLFPKLIYLSLFNCLELRGNLPINLSSTEKLSINYCDHLLATPAPAVHWLSSIKVIDNQGGNGFEEVGERNQLSMLESDSFCLLEDVSISCCGTPFSMPKIILNSTYLKHLKLSEIPSLTAFPDCNLPTSLSSLTIKGCENMTFLPPETWRNYKSLVTFSLVNSCDTLASFPLDGFLALDQLEIYGCDGLESSLDVGVCKALRSLPQEMDTLTALETLYLNSCPVLRSLPQRMDTLTALEALFLNDLPKLELSFSEGTFLPSKLRHFSIELDGRATTPVTEWGLQRLTNLSHLSIEGNVKTLLKERLLPNSLVHLRISKLSEMKSIEGSGLRHLTSLETLFFDDCSVLEPFLEDTLPSSLKELSIYYCPVLEAAYESERGEHWSNIAHFPAININGKVTM